MDNQSNIEDELKESLTNREFEIKATWQADMDAKLDAFNSTKAGLFRVWMLIPIFFLASGSYFYFSSFNKSTKDLTHTHASAETQNSNQNLPSKPTQDRNTTSEETGSSKNSDFISSEVNSTHNKTFDRSSADDSSTLGNSKSQDLNSNAISGEVNSTNNKPFNGSSSDDSSSIENSKLPDLNSNAFPGEGKLTTHTNSNVNNEAISESTSSEENSSGDSTSQNGSQHAPDHTNAKGSSAQSTNKTQDDQGSNSPKISNSNNKATPNKLKQQSAENTSTDQKERTSLNNKNQDYSENNRTQTTEKNSTEIELLRSKKASLTSNVFSPLKLTPLYIPSKKRKKLKMLEFYTGISNSKLKNGSYSGDSALELDENISNLNTSLVGLRFQIENTITTGLEFSHFGEKFSNQDTTVSLNIENTSFYDYEFILTLEVDSMLVDSAYVIDSMMVQVITDSTLITQLDSNYVESIQTNESRNRYSYLNIPIGYEFSLTRSSKLRFTVTPEIYLGIRIKESSSSYEREAFQPKPITIGYGGRISGYYSFGSRYYTALHLNFRNHLLNTDAVFDRKYMSLSGQLGIGMRF